MPLLNNDFYLLRDEPGYRSGEPRNDDDPPESIGPAGFDALRSYLARTTDGHCKDCGEAIPPNGSAFIGLDRLCCDCASDRKVTL